MKGPTPSDFLSLSSEIASGVREIFAAKELNWAMTGEKDGQHIGDVTVDDYVIERLVGGGFSTFSEESGWHGEGRYLVVVDPVDGSTNASRGLPSFALSLALVEGEELLAGRVFDLSNGDLYSAESGKGASLNNQLLKGATGEILLSNAILALNGFPGRYYGWRQYRALGSAALEISMVAAGKIDAFVDHSESGLAPWDYLGALAIAREVGCSFAWLSDYQSQSQGQVQSPFKFEDGFGGGGVVGEYDGESSANLEGDGGDQRFVEAVGGSGGRVECNSAPANLLEVEITNSFRVALSGGRRRLLVARTDQLLDELLSALGRP